MSWLSIEKALFAKVKTLGYTVKPEAVPFDEDSQTTPFLEVFSLPNVSDEEHKNGVEEYNGIYQVSIFSDINVGRGESLGIIDEIGQAFSPGSEITTGTMTIIIDNLNYSQGRLSGNFYQNDVSISYKVLGV